MATTAADVAAFLGQPDDAPTVEQAGKVVPAITAMVRAYTRGGGFVAGVPNAEVDAVILTASARLAANPDQLGHTIGGTGYAVGFQGFNLAELATLNRYRRRAW